MKNEKRTKILAGIGAIAAALLLWIYIVTVVSPETTVTITGIPVVFTGEDSLSARNLTIASKSASTVSMRITGNRTMLSNLSKETITVTVDVSKIQAADTFTRNYTITYPSSVSQSAITVEAIEPAQAMFVVEELITKELEVRVYSDECTTEEGYVIASCQPTVETIKVTGTAEQVADLYRAIVVFDDKNLNENVTRSKTYTVVDDRNNVIDISNLKTDTDRIGVSVKLLYTKNIPLTINIVDGGCATAANLDYLIEPAYVTVSGDKAQLNALNSISLDTVYMEDILDECEMTYAIVIPDGITNESGEIQANVKMSLTGIYKRTLETGSFTLRNVPEGYHVTLLTKGVTIEIRGTDASIETVAAADVNVYVDLSAFANVTGTFTTSDIIVTLPNGIICHVLSCDPVDFEMLTQEEYIHAMGLDAEAAD